MPGSDRNTSVLSIQMLFSLHLLPLHPSPHHHLLLLLLPLLLAVFLLLQLYHTLFLPLQVSVKAVEGFCLQSVIPFPFPYLLLHTLLTLPLPLPSFPFMNCADTQAFILISCLIFSVLLMGDEACLYMK